MANIKISVKHIYIYIFMIGFFRVHLQELFIVKIAIIMMVYLYLSIIYISGWYV